MRPVYCIALAFALLLPGCADLGEGPEHPRRRRAHDYGYGDQRPIPPPSHVRSERAFDEPDRRENREQRSLHRQRDDDKKPDRADQRERQARKKPDRERKQFNRSEDHARNPSGAVKENDMKREPSASTPWQKPAPNKGSR